MALQRRSAKDRPSHGADGGNSQSDPGARRFMAAPHCKNIHYVATLCNLVKCDVAYRFENDIYPGVNVIIESMDSRLRQVSVRMISK
ncbi:hypothetical protein O0544_20195 [Edwardsiella anguillarum]|nr:hypothetical protein [Edwardsiella anguillarum]